MDEIPDKDPTFAPAPTSIFEKKGSGGTKADSQPSGTGAPRGRQSKHKQRKEKLLSLLGTVGSAVMFFEQTDGTIILMNAETLAEATATLADEVPAVAKAIDGMSTGGAYGAFLLALAAIILPILAHHNLVPPFVAQAFIPQEQNNSNAA